MSLSTTARKLKIDIISDVICPFCFIGMKQVEAAVKTYNTTHTPPIEPEIRFLPFKLSSELTEEPIFTREAVAKKFGPERVEAMTNAMRERFRAMGYEMAADAQISSTHLAHRLQTLALQKIPANQPKIANELFEAYHLKGIHPSDRPTLAKVGAKYGVWASEEEGARWLEGDECDEDVEMAYARAKSMGVMGVPFVIVQDTWATSGAVGEEGFLEMFDKAMKKQA